MSPPSPSLKALVGPKCWLQEKCKRRKVEGWAHHPRVLKAPLAQIFDGKGAGWVHDR